MGGVMCGIPSTFKSILEAIGAQENYPLCWQEIEVDKVFQVLDNNSVC